MAHERMDGVIEADRHDHQARTVEDEAAVYHWPTANLPTEKIPFLDGGAQRQPRKTAQLPQEQRWINAWPRLLEESWKVQAYSQQHGGMLPIESLSQGNGPLRPIKNERQRRAFEGAASQTQEHRRIRRDEITFAQVPI